MPDGPFHEVGDFTAGLHFYSDVNLEIAVRIVGEEVPDEEASVWYGRATSVHS